MIKKIIDDDVDNGDDDGDGDDDDDIDDDVDNTDDDNDGVDDHPEYLATLNNAHRSCFYVEIPEKIIEWFFDRMHASYSKVSYEIDHYTEKNGIILSILYLRFKFCQNVHFIFAFVLCPAKAQRKDGGPTN